MLLKNHQFEQKKIVIGSGMRAVTYASENNIPIVMNEINFPQPYEHFEGSSRKFRTRSGFKYVGDSKLYIYKRMLWHLSIKGLAPLGNKTESLRIEDDLLKVTTNDRRLIKIRFQEAFVFNTRNVEGLPFPSGKISSKITVVDWMLARSGAEHEYDLFETKENFVRQVYFFPSARTCGNLSREKPRKDIVAVSYLTKKELNDPEFSDLMVRFRVKGLMDDAGIKGCGKGIHPNGKKRYDPIKIDFDERIVLKPELEKYEDTEFLRFMNG